MSTAAPCPACGAAPRVGARYCEDCGGAIPARCSSCGAMVHPGKRFCGACGERLRAEGWVGDATRHRQASVVALAGSRPGSASLEALHAVADDLEGVVVHRSGGVACVFGARRSLEDHLHRALIAALRLRERPGSAASAGFGVASGRVPSDTGTSPDDPGADDPVAVAISLALTAGPNEALVDPALIPLVPDAIVVEPAWTDGPGSGRDGAEEPPFRVIGTRTGPRPGRRQESRPLSRFVGRERQLRLVEEALTLCASGSGQVIGVVGEAGMGKSRLVEEVHRAVATRARWIEGRCAPFGTNHPYLPVLDLVRELCGVSQPDRPGVADAVTQTCARLEMPAGEASFVRHVLGALDGDDAAIAALTPKAVRIRTFEALRHMFLAAARLDTIVIAVEDLHWADDTSQRFIASLAPAIAGARVLLLATYRPGRRPPWLDLSHATQLTLPRLGPSDSLEVVRSVRDGEEVPEDLGRAILTRGDGNPFFLEELALANPGGTTGAEVVPRTVEDVLTARIDRLDDGPRAVLQNAAVLGRRLTLRLLAAVSTAAAPLPEYLEELEREEFLIGAVVDGEPGYEFKHALTQDVAYQSVSPTGRRELHEVAGLCLEDFYAGRTDEVDGLLAHHWSRTDDAMRAVAYLRRAADRSFRGYAHLEASAMLREAMRHAERLPVAERDRRVVELSLDLVASIYFLGRMTESEEILASLAPRVASASDPGLACAFHFWAAHTASHLGKPDDAERDARSAIDLAHQLGDGAALGRALYIRARQGWWTGRFEEGVRAGEEAVPLLEHAGETWWLGHCHFFVAHSLYSMGRFDAALDAAARGGAIGDAVADPRLRSWAAWAQGLYEAARGDTERGVAQCLRGIELSPDEPNTAWALGALGFSRREHGDLEEAIDDLQRAIDIAERTNHPGILARFLGWLGEARRRAGDLAGASEATTRSGRIGGEIGCRWVVALALRTRGRIAFDRGDLVAARRLLGEARAALEAIGSTFDLALCHGDLARLAVADGRDPGPAVETALTILGRVNSPVHRARLRALARELGVSEHDPAGRARLTGRELEVLGLVASGLTNRQIAERLVISEGTAIRHVSNIFAKLGVNTRSAATRAALDRGLVSSGPGDADRVPEATGIYIGT